MAEPCSLHAGLQAEINRIKMTQEARPCRENAVRLESIKEALGEIKDTNSEQWKEIDKLKRLVYMGAGAAGVLAFFGSIIGGFVKS